MNEQRADELMVQMERMILDLRARTLPMMGSIDPLELTDAIDEQDARQQTHLSIPESVLREFLSAHLDSAGNDIMLAFEEAMDRMNAGVRETLEEQLNLMRRQMREELRTVLHRVTQLSKK